MKWIRIFSVGLSFLWGRDALAVDRLTQLEYEDWFDRLDIEEKVDYCQRLYSDEFYSSNEDLNSKDWEIIDIATQECESLVVPTTYPTIGEESKEDGVWL